jgi:hypothetical protein
MVTLRRVMTRWSWMVVAPNLQQVVDATRVDWVEPPPEQRASKSRGFRLAVGSDKY